MHQGTIPEEPSRMKMNLVSDATEYEALLEKFKNCLLCSVSVACVDVETDVKSVVASKLIGQRILQQCKTPKNNKEDTARGERNRELEAVVCGGSKRRRLVGLAVSLDGHTAHVFSLDKERDGGERAEWVRRLLLCSRAPGAGAEEGRTVVMFDAKNQLRVLWQTVFHGCEMFPPKGTSVVDPKAAAWYLDAGVGEKGLAEVVSLSYSYLLFKIYLIIKI